MITALLAIDIGGSTSRATLIDRNGNCLGLGRNRGGNPGSNPPAEAAAAVVAAAESAVTQADVPLDIKVAMLAMAGVRNADSLRLMEEGFRRLGLTGPMVMTGDTHAMLPSVSAATDGYCIFCGTGSGAVKIRNDAVETVADAAGYLIGDLGSGFWLGHHAAIAVCSDLDGRGPATALTPAILGSLGIETTRDVAFDGRPTPLRHFIDAVYAMRPIELAKFAPQVIANREDPIAAALLAQSEAFLLADFRKIFDPEVRGPVVLGGSVAAHLKGLPAEIGKVLEAAGHQADIRLAGDGAIGAAVLALRHEGITVDEAMLQHITASMAARAAKV
jgi:N-acetylglucosamine kinase-like BadF-type ATPase